MIKDYKVYIKTKTSQYKPYRKLQILSVLEQTWSSIIIDFIVKLSKSKDLVNNINYNSILVIIKRFIKYNKFIPTNESYSTKDLTDIIIRKVINNYRLLNEFIINKSIIFVFRFFITFITRFGMNNKVSIAFYLQTDK